MKKILAWMLAAMMVLGCGAAMSALRRISCGSFTVSDAHSLERSSVVETTVPLSTTLTV